MTLDVFLQFHVRLISWILLKYLRNPLADKQTGILTKINEKGWHLCAYFLFLLLLFWRLMWMKFGSNCKFTFKFFIYKPHIVQIIKRSRTCINIVTYFVAHNLSLNGKGFVRNLKVMLSQNTKWQSLSMWEWVLISIKDKE